MNVFKEELPHDPRRAHFGWFLAGVTIYAALILVVAAVEHGGEPTRTEAEAAAGSHAPLSARRGGGGPTSAISTTA